MKICKTCNRELDEKEFTSDKRMIGGKRNTCKQCDRDRIYAWRIKNPEKFKAIHKKYYTTKDNRKNYCSAAIQHKRNSKKYEVIITSKELLAIAISTVYCPICGTKINYERGKCKISHDSPSLDRINNEKILTKENCWIICQRCNTTKSDRSMNDFIEYCNTVIKKFRE
jgi:hypothetical protein